MNNNSIPKFHWIYNDFEIKPTIDKRTYELVEWYDTWDEVDYTVIGKLTLDNAFMFDTSLLKDYSNDDYTILCDLLSNAQKVLNKYIVR